MTVPNHRMILKIQAAISPAKDLEIYCLLMVAVKPDGNVDNLMPSE